MALNAEHESAAVDSRGRKPPFARAALVTLGLFAAGALAAQESEPNTADRARRFAPVAMLAGACWSGELQPRMTDRHCWEWDVQGAFLRDSHEVRTEGHAGMYSGVTYYQWTEEHGLRFWYFNSLGGVSTGGVAAPGEPGQAEGQQGQPSKWLFTESYESSADSANGGQAAPDQEVRTLFLREDEGSYTIRSEHRRLENGKPVSEWQLMMEARYRREVAP